MSYLTPDFQCIPIELIKIEQWVVWKEQKVPFNPKKPRRKAATDNPATWGSFEEAIALYKQGGWEGVGFVLDGDGLVGVDIDKCITDGKPDPVALSILDQLDAAYVEISPSGSGLRAFGYGPKLETGRKGVFNGINVELYSQGRYLTVTGHVLKQGPLRQFKEFKELAESLHNPTEETEAIEDTEAIEATDFNISSSVNTADQIINWPNKVIPKKVGQRNQKLFALARWLKGKEPEATKDRQLHFVRQWYSTFRHTIGTEDFGVSWAEFQIAWKKVQFPEGIVLKACLENIKPLPKIDGIEIYGVNARHLMQVCVALQDHFGSEPFFLSVRQAEKLCGCHFTHAAVFLESFIDQGWIEIVEKETAVKARRFRLKFDGWEGLIV